MKTNIFKPKSRKLRTLLGTPMLTASLLLFLATSCIGDLNTRPLDKDITSPEDVYKDPAAYKQVLAKIYSVFALSGQVGPNGNPDIATDDEGTSNYLRQYWNLQVLTTDEAICAWNNVGIPDLHNQSWSAANDYITVTYERIFYLISVANEFLRESTDSQLQARNIPESYWNEIHDYRNEARLIRALAYYQAIDLYGNVPFVLENDGVGSYYPKQIKRAALFDWLTTELKTLEPLMKEPHTNEYGRADKGLAWTLLAKLYLNAGIYTGTPMYTEAITWCNQIIPYYELEENYTHLFMADNHTAKGIIFPIAFDGEYTQTYGGTSFIIHAAIGGDSIAPLNYGVNGGWAGNRSTLQFARKFEDGDQRALFFTTGQNNLEVLQPLNFKQGVIITKFSNIKSTGGTGSNLEFVDTDFPMFRIADIYLMYAEAVLRGGTGGNTGDALIYINRIRTRAFGNTSHNIAGGQLTLDFILEERARELYWEGHRRTDLIRFGKFSQTDYSWPWKGGVKEGKSVSNIYNLFPLPSSDLGANPDLEQNTGY